MLRWALIFLVVAIIAEFFGFSGVAGQAVWIAHVLFVIAIIFLIISLVTGRGGPPVTCWDLACRISSAQVSKTLSLYEESDANEILRLKSLTRMTGPSLHHRGVGNAT